MQFATIPMEQFPLRWRFTDPTYDVLPPDHLAQVRPLAPADARRLHSLIHEAGLHRHLPFTDAFFRSVVTTCIDRETDDTTTEERRIRKWLYQRGVPFRHRVWLRYDQKCAIETTWKMLVKYWSAFFCPSSDDVTVIDGSFTWALLFFHEGELSFGSNI